MLTVAKLLVQSRKAWVVLLAIIGAVLLAALGRISAAESLEFVKWIVVAWLGAIAAEDAAEKHRSDS